MILLIVALVVLAYAAGAFTQAWCRRPPAIPSTAYFLERDHEPVTRAENMRRVVRAAIEDWQDAYRMQETSREAREGK